MRILSLVLLINMCWGNTTLSNIIELVNENKYDQAEQLLDPYLEANKEDHTANFLKALILTHKENYAGAVGFIEQAIQLKNDQPEYYRLAGQLYEKLDKKDLAIAAWENCIKHTKNAELIQEANTHLNYLKEK